MIDERTRMRRSDRAVTDDAEIAAHLGRAKIGFVATCHDEQPYIHSNLFWFDTRSRTVYFHTALEGRTRQNIERNPRVCFTVAEMGRLLPAETAYEFSTEYASVCAFGTARLVQTDEEKRRALQGLLDKYFPDLQPGQDYRPMTSDEVDGTAVFAIEIDAWSGKRKSVAE
jgi:nitroimidazol reductase NimA-like FMN-containing flavoprotein (pyridoxamine 5'-phosphate oxidase superfamily)